MVKAAGFDADTDDCSTDRDVLQLRGDCRQEAVCQREGDDLFIGSQTFHLQRARLRIQSQHMIEVTQRNRVAVVITAPRVAEQVGRRTLADAYAAIEVGTSGDDPRFSLLVDREVGVGVGHGR